MPTGSQAAPKQRVLYAEDQESARTVTAALLQRLGYDVEAVEDGERAVECARAAHYDVILLDIEMPVMDGVTAARIIRNEAAPCRNSPIVALSAFLADSTEHAEWRGTFDRALPKPANTNELREAVANALKDRHALLSDLHEDLRAVLPKGAWNRLAAKAADEMHGLALSLMTCREAEDVELALRLSQALRTLASNFGAADVARLAGAESGSPDQQLLTSIYAWKAANS